MKKEYVQVTTKGFKDRYLISNYGEVYTILNDKFLKPYKNISGRHYIYLSKNGISKAFSVSRLVLTHFKRHPNIKEISAFLDNNFDNNQVDNLKWMTLGNWFRYRRTFKGKIKGVYKHVNGSGTKKWRSTLQINGKVKTFGYFDTKEEAVICTYKTYMEKFGYAPW